MYLSVLPPPVLKPDPELLFHLPHRHLQHLRGHYQRQEAGSLGSGDVLVRSGHPRLLCTRARGADVPGGAQAQGGQRTHEVAIVRLQQACQYGLMMSLCFPHCHTVSLLKPSM